MMFELYPALTSEQVKDAAQAIASDEFISLSTWNWMDLVTRVGSKPTYYYLYDHIRPLTKPEYWKNSWPQLAARGATHSAEIEYALGNLEVNNIYQWAEQDYQVSALMQDYFVNFIKNGDPNGKMGTKWPKFSEGKQLVITQSPYAESINALSNRYKGLNKLKNITQ